LFLEVLGVKKVAILFCVLVISFCFCACVDKSSSVVRIHIRANSNLECDQSVKLLVRDSVIDYINDSESDTLLPVNSFSSGSTVISSEYLRLIYSRLGIIVNGRINELFYCVKLPDGWMVKKDGNNFNLVDEDGNVILSFYVSSQTCDKEVYVTYINDKLSERGPAILIKK